MANAERRNHDARDDAPGDAARPPRPIVHLRDGWRDRVPGELKALRQWVLWLYEWRPGKPADPAKRRPATSGKWTKVPYQPEAPVSRARNDAPRTWGAFDRALRALEREPDVFSGIGFVFAAGDPYCGFDFDACLAAGSGAVAPWAADPLGLFEGAYREISPSGTGIKGIVRAGLGDRKGTNVRGLGDDGKGAIEVYDRGRFFAITGEAWGDGHAGAGGAVAIIDAQDATDALFAHIEALRARKEAERRAAGRGADRAGRGRRPAGDAHEFLGRAPAADDALLALARSNATNGAAFSALYDRGELNGYPSDSEADGALCCHLAFWTQKDAGRMERLWLASALGRRGKVVDRADYRAATIASAIEKTANIYRPMPRPPMPGEASEARGRLDAADELPWTDRGLAERVVRLYGHLVRYCQPWKKWLIWDGRRWKADDTLQVDRYVKATIRRMQVEEAATIADREAADAFRKWAIGCESKRAHEAALVLLRHEDGIPVTPDGLDATPWLLNCPNGTVDLATGRLRPHDRADLITKLCPVEFDPGATAPLWGETLRRFLPDDGLRDWVDRLFGYALTGTIREHLLAIFYGLGANGKTTILNALYGVMGTDYALKAPPNLLMQKRGNAHPTEQASLFGKRLVIAAETGEGERFDESLVKELTGDEPITARRMREDFWSFSPTHKIILATNHKPSVKGNDNGIWRRLKLVEFGISLEAAEQDTAIPGRLREEYPGILARAVKSCLVWRETGLADPPVIVEATRSYKDAEDVYGQFINEICDKEDGAECKSSIIYSSYKYWAKFNGFSVASMRRFSRAIEDKGFKKKKNDCMVFEGLRLRNDGGPIILDDDCSTPDFSREERED